MQPHQPIFMSMSSIYLLDFQALCSRQSIRAVAELVLGGAVGSIGLPSSISPPGPQGLSLDTRAQGL